jgi:hypothetical protein
MKYIRRHNLNPNNILDDVILQRADGNIELNPAQRVIINGNLEFPPGVGIPGPEVSNVMYVTVDGNDDNTGYGEGPTQAKRTIKSACDSAVPGTTIFVRTGEYYEDNPIRVPPKVSIIGDNLRRTILYPKNGPLVFSIVNVEKANGIVTITTDEDHGLKPKDRVRIRADIGTPVTAGNFVIGKKYRILLLGTTDFIQIGSAYNTRGTFFTATGVGQGTGTAYLAEIDETDVNVLEVIDDNTFTYRQSGDDIPSTVSTGRVLEGIDFFYCNSAAYIAQLVFKGLRAPAYCINIDSDAIVDTSPYIQNCSNINGPWMRNGEEWIPFQTKQPDLSGTFVSGPRPLLDNEIDPTQVNQYGIDIEGAGSGCLVDGDRYSPISPIKSMVGDAFTQIAQGAIGFHITNFGYMQIVSCFAVFCSKAFYATRGGYLSLSNSVIDFGTQGFIADGYYLDPYSVGKMPQDYYSTAGSVTVLNEGRGYLEIPTVTIEPPNPLIVGARQATAVASIDPIRGTINAISVDDPGYGYDFVPEVIIDAPTGAEPVQATGLVNLQKNLSVLVSKLANKPQVGSIMFLGDDPQAYYIASTIGNFVAFDYDEIKCRRDAEIILNGIYYDVGLATNYNAVINGRSYQRAMASEVIEDQLEQTIGAINFLKSRSAAVLSTDSTAQNRSNLAFDEIINIIQSGINQADPLIFPSPTGVDTNKEHARDQLIANREFIQEEIIAWIALNYPLLAYNETTCARDVGYIVDALCYDVLYGGNSATIVAARAYFEGAVSVLPEDQVLPTAAAFARLSEVCQQVVQEMSVSVTVGNPLTQDVSGTPASATEATQILNLIALIEGVITAESVSGLPAPTTPLVGWVDPLTLSAINELNDDIPQIIEEMIDYIDLNYVTPFKYDQQKCRRDVGLIIDAVLADAVLNTNHRAAYAGISYLRSTASKVTSLQKSQTIDALTVAKDLTAALTTIPDLQNKIIEGFATVINIINLGDSVVPAISIPPTSVREPGYAEAADILLANKTFIQDEIVAWINLNYPRFTYDEVKCSRDVGLILNAIVDDIVFDSNYRSITAGLSYLRSYASEVTENQKRQTISGIDRAKDLAIALIADDQLRDEIESRFKIITDIIDDVNASSVPQLVFTDAISNANGNASVKVLQANRDFLKSEIIAWINYQIITNTAPFDSSFRYNRETCSRDIGYVVDALCYDIIYGGNSQTKHAAETYYIGAASVIEGQETQSVAAFTRLKNIISSVVQNITVIKTPGNTKTQNTSFPPGTGGIGTTLQGLIDIINDVIIDGETSITTVSPTYTSGIEYTDKNYVRTAILAAETSIRNGVITYLNSTFAAPLDEVNTRNDLSCVIDGIAYDLTYEGNLATSTAASAYGDGSVIKSVLVESLESQKYFKSIIGKIVKNESIALTAGNLSTQNLSLPIGSPVNSQGPSRKAESLLQIVIEVIQEGTGLLPDPVISPEYANGDAIYLAERNNILLSLDDVQDATIDFLNQEYGGQITIETFPPIQSVAKDTVARFHNVSTVSTGATAMEYVGAGVTYNALPFFGGEPEPRNERIEINNGKCFTVTSDQIGNYRIGEFFTVNALTGEITIDAEKLNLSGLASIGPFRRNGIPVGVALREVSNNPNLISSTGSQDGNTAPTQQAVATYVENRYLNKVSLTAQSVESNVTFVGDVDVNGGDIRTSQPFFNLVNETAENINFAGAATTLNIGAETGTTTINNDLKINGSVISSPQLEVDVVNTFTETVNFAGDATEINIGASTGVLSIKNSTVTLDNASLLSINGVDPVIESADTGTLTLFNNNITEVEAFGDATLITFGAPSGEVVIRGDLAVNDGDLTTTQNEFNLINTNATVVNFAGAATDINIGSNTGTTTVNNSFDVLQNTVLGADTTAFTTIKGEITLSIRDNTSTVLNVTEASDTYIKVDTTNGNELITFGSTPKFTVLNSTESTNTTTGSVTVAGGVGIVKNINVGGSATVLGNTSFGNERAVDTHQISGRTQIDIPDNNAEAFKLTENTQDYITAVTTDGAEALIVGTTPRVLIGNTTDSTDKDTGAVVIDGGVGIEKNLNVGVNFSAGGNAAVTGDLAVNGGDITTTATTFNLLDNNATTVNAFGDATTINVGAATGTLTVNNTATVFNSTSHIVIPVGDTGQRPDPAVAGMIRYNTQLSTFEGYATAWGSLGGVKDVDGNTYIIPETFPGANENILYFYNDGTLTATLDIASFSLLQNTSSSSTTTGTLKVTGGVGISENINVGGTANVTGNTTLSGTLAVTGNTTITGDLAVNGGDITSTAATFNLVTGSATVNFATGSTVLEIGSSNGTTNVNNNLVVDKDVSIVGFTPVTVENYAAGTDYTAAGTGWNTNTLTIEDPQGTLITRLTGFVVGSTFSIIYYDEDLAETVSGTVELATVFGISGTTYTATTVQTAPTTPVTDISAVAITVIGVGSANLNTTNTVFNLVNSTATTVNFAGAATTVNIGASGSAGTLTVNNDNVVLNGDLAVNGGDVTTTASTFNLINATATTVNAFGAATSIEIGASTGTTNINNDLDVDGDINIDGGDLTASTTTFNLVDTTVTTLNIAGIATAVNLADDATAASTLLFGPTITGNTVKIASTASGTINLTTDVTSGTVNLFNSITGTTNIASSGTINLGNNTDATTLVDVGGAITGNTFKISSTTDGIINLTTDVISGTVNLFNQVTTGGTVNLATGAEVTINIGGVDSTVNIKQLTLTTDLAVQYGGTGVGTFTTNGVIFGNGTDPLQVTAASLPGSNATISYGILTTDVNNVPVWTDTIDGGSY